MKRYRSINCRKGLCDRRAFSMVEVVLVVIIIGLLASVATSRYMKFTVSQRLEAASRRVIADLTYARTWAKQIADNVTVEFDTTDNEYTLNDIADMNRPSVTDTVVDLDLEPYKVDITQADFSGDGIVIFDGFGVPGSGGTIGLGIGDYTATITVNADTGIATRN